MIVEPRITVTRAKGIGHEDDDEAGFTDGYRWTLTDDLGTAESFAPTKAAAQQAAESARDVRSGVAPAE